MLIREDFHTRTWDRLVAMLTARRDVLRIELESLTLDERKTAVVRGRISEINKWLALPTAVSPGEPGRDERPDSTDPHGITF